VASICRGVHSGQLYGVFEADGTSFANDNVVREADGISFANDIFREVDGTSFANDNVLERWMECHLQMITSSRGGWNVIWQYSPICINWSHKRPAITSGGWRRLVLTLTTHHSDRGFVVVVGSSSPFRHAGNRKNQSKLKST
jgi:hypothetical protein